MGFRSWVKRQLPVVGQVPDAVMDKPSQPGAPPVRLPVFPAAGHGAAGMVTQRRWRDPPHAGVSVVWRPGTRGGAGGITTWFGDTVDPLIFEKVDVFTDRREAERRQAVLFSAAGTNHRRRDLDRPEFAAGQQVLLVPDPRNRYDKNAIEVRDFAGQYTVGFVPRDREEQLFAQGLLCGWLSQGPVAALILSERAWSDDNGQPTSQRGGITVLAGPRIECVEVPAQGDAEYGQFAAARLRARTDAWPQRRIELQRQIDGTTDLEARHFALQGLIEEAYRLRDAHPDALDDAVAACREQISLAPQVAALMRRNYGQLPGHVGYRQLAIILEKQKAYGSAAELAEQARAQGWDGDWDKRLERLRRRQA